MDGPVGSIYKLSLAWLQENTTTSNDRWPLSICMCGACLRFDSFLERFIAIGKYVDQRKHLP